MDDEDSFYSAAAHAVGDDGSSQAKETVRRDLDAAAAAYMQVFKGEMIIPVRPPPPPQPKARRKPPDPRDMPIPIARQQTDGPENNLII